jgi:hypothetical protein
MAVELIKYIVGAFFLLFFQYFLIQEINFGTWIKPMPYIFFLFILPLTTNRFAVLISAFFAGLLLDLVSATGGMHSAACLTLAFTKVMADENILNKDAILLQGYKYLEPRYKSFNYYIYYIFTLTFIHHLVYFSLDYFRFSAFFLIITVALLSAVFTVGFILLIRLLLRQS